jgi:predicted DCC family thiol-disulfide oxidoreductase YuxK
MKSIPVVIDGECNFCRFSSQLLRKIINRPLDIQFQGSNEAQKWEDEFIHSNWKVDSIKVLSGENLYIKSEAISFLMRYAKWYIQPLRVTFLLPKAFLDRGYDWIAKNRFLWGETCELND